LSVRGIALCEDSLTESSLCHASINIVSNNQVLLILLAPLCVKKSHW